ncbi:hypothetical protein PIB30_068605 [Stylosanthes scabra]|uniref:Pre-mRNA-processing factor 19 n=1 Tax=Stylosanthes scabra TaxID=79078 RepID=A0ABU6WL77_9FABA|nr:hypothetical protein [Stylosanthes scabra]
MEAYTQISSHSFHKTNKPGIISLDILYSKDLIATGGIDTNAVIFHRPSGQILTVRVWQGSDDDTYNCKHILRDHTAEVEDVTVHATNNYFATASLDGTWCFYDLSSGTCLTQVSDTSGSSEGYTSAAFHPDGLILGTGTTDALIKIWDLKCPAYVAKFEGHAGPVTALSFSENGYFRNFAPYDSETPTNSGIYFLPMLTFAISIILREQMVLNNQV